MMIVPAGVKVHLALGYTDMRKGMDGLAMLVQETLKKDPFCGHLFAFRGKRAQHATFCIQSSKRDNCVSVASPFWTNASSRTVPTRQGFEMYLYGGAAWV